VELERALEEEILVAQFSSGLDIQDREPENSFESDVPHYQSLVAEAVSAGLNVPEPPPIAQEDEGLAYQTLVVPGHQAITYLQQIQQQEPPGQQPPNAPQPGPNQPGMAQAGQPQAGDKLHGSPPEFFDGS